MHYNNLFTFT